MEKVLIFDTETTGLPPKGAKYDTDFMQFPRVVQLAWQFNGELKNYIVKPFGWEIPEEATKVHGITTERAIKEGLPFQTIMDEFIHDCQQAEKIIGHNIYFDTSIIKSNILRMKMPRFFENIVEPALHKDKRICTMYKTIKFVGAKFPDGRPGKFPRLEELYEKLFNETFPAHDAAEDVKATARCVDELVKLQLIEIFPAGN